MIDRERKGAFLGKTVQMVPHVSKIFHARLLSGKLEVSSLSSFFFWCQELLFLFFAIRGELLIERTIKGDGRHPRHHLTRGFHSRG